MDFFVKRMDLAEEGQALLERTLLKMPLLDLFGMRFHNFRTFEGLKISMCKHVTAETAALALTLQQGGAEIFMAASNPRSTQDAIAAALVKYHGIHVWAASDETPAEYRDYMDRIIRVRPDIILDDGASVLPAIYERYPEIAKDLIGTTEQTTAGVAKVEEMDRAGKLVHPVIAVNSSKSKHLYDNRYGVGQSFIDAFMRVMEMMICGHTLVVCGYGYCGRGIAERAKGMGANVIVTEIDPFRAMDAVMAGFRVMPLEDATAYGDIFVTVTGNTDIITYSMMERMKSGAIVANCGSGSTEIDMVTLKEKAVRVYPLKEHLDEYVLPNGTRIQVIADGRVANLVCAGGNPADVMDMSFAVVSCGIEYLLENRGKLENHVFRLPYESDRLIVNLKLTAMGIQLDKQSEVQKNYSKRFVMHS